VELGQPLFELKREDDSSTISMIENSRRGLTAVGYLVYLSHKQKLWSTITPVHQHHPSLAFPKPGALPAIS
jgi:hypothetical protein